MVVFLFRLLKGTDPASWDQNWLAYDNTCNVLRKATKEKLNLNAPYDELFLKVQKCIDGLSIRNHVGECKEAIHPDRIFQMDPDLRGERNSMAAEQTFVWSSRFKKIVSGMTKRHHLFFMHRMVVYRNR